MDQVSLRCSPSISPEQELESILFTALGERIGVFLKDPLVTEVRRNSDGSVWVSRLGEGRQKTDVKISEKDATRAILAIASSVDELCGKDKRSVSAELPGSGARFQGVLPPLSQSPVFAIRKKAIRIFSLDDFVSQEVITELEAKQLKRSVTERKNILIVGGTDSGKTTFANALLREIVGFERVVIIQDIEELQCDVEDVEYLRTKDGLASLKDLVKLTLRLSPERIVIGEVRGAEALDLLKAWNTGHAGGVSTIHANSARQGLSRLEQLVEESEVRASREMIAEAIQIIIFMEKVGTQRVVREIKEVTGVKKGEYELRDVA